MTDAEFVILRSVWDHGDATARQDAWTSVKVWLKATKNDGLLDDARDRIGSWVNNYNPAIQMETGYTLGGGQGMDQGSIRKAAFPPMLDAIAATICADGLDQDERHALLKPFQAIAP
jgi:hypothetical protein